MAHLNRTACCALVHLRASNFDTPEDINKEISKARFNQIPGVFVIVAKGEGKLEEELKKLGFELLKTFPRPIFHKKGVEKLYFFNTYENTNYMNLYSKVEGGFPSVPPHLEIHFPGNETSPFEVDNVEVFEEGEAEEEQGEPGEGE